MAEDRNAKVIYMLIGLFLLFMSGWYASEGEGWMALLLFIGFMASMSKLSDRD